MESGVAGPLFWGILHSKHALDSCWSLRSAPRLVVGRSATDRVVLDTLTAGAGVLVIDMSDISSQQLEQYDEVVVCLGHKYVGCEDIVEELESTLGDLLRIMRPTCRARAGHNVRIITRCEPALVGLGREAPAHCSAGYAVWAASRSIIAEHTFEKPFNLQCIALADLKPGTLALLPQMIASPIAVEAPLLLLKSGSAYAPQLGQLVTQAAARPAIQADSAYVVSGGRTGLGWKTVEWLLKQGAGYAIVLSTKPESQVDASQKEFIMKHRARVFWPGSVDIVEQPQVQMALQEFNRIHPGVQIRGVFHSAAEFCQKLLPDLTTDDVSRSLRPNVSGAINLHMAVRQAGFELDHFQMFSTIACVVGNPFQAMYAAANAGMEIVACMLRADGVPAQSVQWSALDVGSVNSSVKSALLARGMAVMDHRQLEDGLSECVRFEAPQVIVAALDPGLLAKSVLLQNPSLQHLFRAALPAELQNTQPYCSIAEKFDRIAEMIRLRPQLMQEVSDATKMGLYACFKQATEGDCPKRSNVSLRAVGKSNAWMRMRGKTQTEAQERYIELAKSLGVSWPVDMEEKEPSPKRPRQ